MRNGSEPLVVTCHHGGMERNKENISPRRPPLAQDNIYLSPLSINIPLAKYFGIRILQIFPELVR